MLFAATQTAHGFAHEHEVTELPPDEFEPGPQAVHASGLCEEAKKFAAQ